MLAKVINRPRTTSLTPTTLSTFPSISSLFDEFMNIDKLLDNNLTLSSSSLSLPTTMYKKDNKIHMLIDLSNYVGVDRDNINLDWHDGVLTVSGEYKKTQDISIPSDATILLDEMNNDTSTYSFTRSYDLSRYGVKGDDTKAKFKDGVLKLTIPINSRKIRIE